MEANVLNFVIAALGAVVVIALIVRILSARRRGRSVKEAFRPLTGAMAEASRSDGLDPQEHRIPQLRHHQPPNHPPQNSQDR
ncbi:hypothetical protein [Nesterenkonia populi]